MVGESPRVSRARRVLAARYRDEGHPHPELAAALVVARGERDLTVSDLAATLDVDAAVLASLEAGAAEAWSAPVAIRRFVASRPDRASRVRGSLLAGAVGDALGAPIEFAAHPSLPSRFGAITDDTQMTLFTAEGLLRSWPGDDPLPAIAAAYQRWLATQSGGLRLASGDGGWLSSHPFLHARRAPGTTCLTALEMGAPVAGSKGCGGVMRVAPIGLVGLSVADAFSLGARAAALTHGHPTGSLTAGVLAALVTSVASGAWLPDAVPLAVDELTRHVHHDETLAAVRAAVDLAAGGPPTRGRVESLGEGWVAEEALAIGLYCALAAGDARSALVAAVEHRGDSDSTGSICGNLVGASLGVDLVPDEWLDALEGREVIEAVADDLLDGGTSHPERWPLA